MVPGYYGTYWVKHLNAVSVLDKPFEGFWMKSAYRIPDNECACTEPGKAADKTVPIGRFKRPLLRDEPDGRAGGEGRSSCPCAASPSTAGSGIRAVEVSTDDGKSWAGATLGQDLGRYAFRTWTSEVALAPGAHALRVRATGNDGGTQPMEPRWNPAGYMRNVVETTR